METQLLFSPGCPGKSSKALHAVCCRWQRLLSHLETRCGADTPRLAIVVRLTVGIEPTCLFCACV